MVTLSSILVWKVPWKRTLVGYSPWGRKVLNVTERLGVHIFLTARVPILRDLMPDDLRWSWGHNNRKKVHNKWNGFESSWSLQCPLAPPHPQSKEKLSFTKPAPGAKNIEDCSLKAFGGLCGHLWNAIEWQWGQSGRCYCSCVPRRSDGIPDPPQDAEWGQQVHLPTAAGGPVWAGGSCWCSRGASPKPMEHQKWRQGKEWGKRSRIFPPAPPCFILPSAVSF